MAGSGATDEPMGALWWMVIGPEFSANVAECPIGDRYDSAAVFALDGPLTRYKSARVQHDRDRKTYHTCAVDETTSEPLSSESAHPAGWSLSGCLPSGLTIRADPRFYAS